MKFKGQINGDPMSILMDTGASGTAFIDRKFCKDETIPLYPAPPHQVIVLGNNTQIPASDMATVTVKVGTFRFSFECLVLDKLPDYPLVLGNPWLLKYDADMSFLRKQVVLKRPDGRQICLNAITSKPLS
jgi:predicted aspartyl protease